MSVYFSLFFLVSLLSLSIDRFVLADNDLIDDCKLSARYLDGLTAKEVGLLEDLCVTDADVESARQLGAGLSPNPEVACNVTQWCDSLGHCTSVCARGSVPLDPWLTWALGFQLDLARQQPFCYSQLPSSHNSAITFADGYGELDAAFQEYFRYIRWVAPDAVLRTNNQWYSLTDQLNMGARVLELDTHWFSGDLRIGHCGGLHVPTLNRLVEALNLLAKLFQHEIRWDTETFGCSPSLSSIPAGDQRPLTEALREVADWLRQPENAREFVVLLFDDQADLEDWDKVQLLLHKVKEAFAVDDIVTPVELRGRLGGRWPSIEDLVTAGKRLLLVSVKDYGEEMAPLIFARGSNLCDWDEPTPARVSGPPECSALSQRSKYTEREATMAGTIIRTLDCEIRYGPLNCDFDWGDNTYVLDESTIPPLVACGVNMPSPDLLTPTRMKAFVWSWAEGHPSRQPPPSPDTNAGWRRPLPGHIREDPLCSEVRAADGRWYAVACESEHSQPRACRNAGADKQGRGGGDSSAAPPLWELALPGQVCPEGYEPDVPHTPKENLGLQTALASSKHEAAWLPLRGPHWRPVWLHNSLRRSAATMLQV